MLHAIPYKEHYALIATAETYGGTTGYARLCNPNRDGESIEISLRRHGYDSSHVLRVPGATKAQFLSGVMQVIQQIQGKDRALVLIFLSGHGIQVLGSLFWAGEDVVNGDHKTYLNLPQTIKQLQQIHTKKGMEDFGCEQVSTRAHFVFFLDFCREAQTPNETLLDQWYSPAASFFPDGNRAAISLVCATSSGWMARDRSDASEGHSPFARAFLESARDFQTLQELLKHMEDVLQQTSEGRQAIALVQLDPKADTTTIFPIRSLDPPQQSSQPLLSHISTSTMQSSQDRPQVSTSEASLV